MLAAGPFAGYCWTDGAIPVVHPPRLGGEAATVARVLGAGAHHLSDLLCTDAPRVEALLLPERDWCEAPREGRRPYPYGLPYFTRSTDPPTLVLPEMLSPAFGPVTEATLPLTLWHGLAHAFLLADDIVRTPLWLGELLPQTAAVAVARRTELPLEDHLRRLDRDPGFTVHSFASPADAEDQMKFQNLLLLLGDAALRGSGEGFLRRLSRLLRDEHDPVDEEGAEAMLAAAIGQGGLAWSASRGEWW